MLKRRSTGFIPYPRDAITRTVARLPLQLYNMGFGWVLGWTPFLVLTTRGRVSGLARHVVLEYRKHGSKYYVFSVWGTRPNWYKNLLAHPEVTLQFGQRTLAARAIPVTDSGEALRALYMFRRNSPIYEVILSSISTTDTIDLRTLTEVADQFTVIRFEVIPDTPPSLPGLEAKRSWVGRILLLTVFIGMIWQIRRALRRTPSSEDGLRPDTTTDDLISDSE